MLTHFKIGIPRVLVYSIVVLFIAFCSPNLTHAASVEQRQRVVVLNVNGAIGPATQNYIERGIDSAIAKKADLVVIYLDTPGGLDKSMRLIVRKIISSPIPIATYVAPSGARAASAGTYILYASHIAAMAPGTNLGAATPVSIGGGFGGTKEKEATEKKKATSLPSMEEKIKSDASAYIRSLAQLRERNVLWAQEAVLHAASLSANEALKLGVIDLIADNLKDLLQKLEGKKVIAQGKVINLHFSQVGIDRISPDWRTAFLEVITDPNVAYILLLIGIYGLFFEFMNPGFVLPGVAGLIALLIALYAFQLLPVNYVGLFLLLAGIIFMIAEALVPSFGALGIGGIIAFIVGSILLYDTSAHGFGVMLPVILAFAFVTALFLLLVANMALYARRKPIVSGREEVIGSIGTVTFAGKKNLPRMRLRGELWQIRSDHPLKEGEKVRVVRMDGLILFVEPVTDQDKLKE